MGSVGSKKCSPAMLLDAGLNYHYDKELRMSETIEHANKDIDRSLTHLNYDLSYGDDGSIVRDAMTWSQAKAMIQRKVDEIDEVTPPLRRQSDTIRRTWYMLEIHCPKEISDMGREEEFFEKAFENLNQSMDGNIIWGQVHKDEIHDYWKSTGKKDADGKTIYEQRTSLPHMDVIGIPYLEGKGVCSKDFWAPKAGRMKAMQKSVHDMVLREFGVDMWTYEGHSPLTIEQYKEQSATIERTVQLEKAAVELEKKTQGLEVEAGDFEKRVSTSRASLKAIKAKRREEEEKVERLTKTAEVLERTKVPATWEPDYRGFGKNKELLGYYIPCGEAESMLRRAELGTDLIAKSKELDAREAVLLSKEAKIDENLEYSQQKRTEALELKREVSADRERLTATIEELAGEKFREALEKLGLSEAYDEVVQLEEETERMRFSFGRSR